jgi:cytidylate kinase
MTLMAHLPERPKPPHAHDRGSEGFRGEHWHNAAQRRFGQYIEATIQEMAARDDVVLVGLASTIILTGMPHTLRARVTAPEGRRAERVAQAQDLVPTAALDRVRQSDRERASRVRFPYHADLDDRFCTIS